MNTLSKILVIRFSSMGDIVLASPLLRALRITFPSSQIDFVVRKEYAELVRDSPYLHRVYEYDAQTGFSGLQTLKQQIRDARYDLVVDIHKSLRSRYLRLFLGAGKVVSFHKHIIARTVLVRWKKNFYQNVTSIADRYIDSVRRYGIQNDGKGLELNMPDAVRTQALVTVQNLAGRKNNELFIGFCPSARHATKRWPQERFVELGGRLTNDFHANILIFGGPEDKHACFSIAQGINSCQSKNRAIDLSGELSILESAAAMELCSVIVTNDSGLMHVACAMKKKVVAIFGSTVREFGFFPVGTESRIVERPDVACRPCSHIGRSSCPKGHFRCMKEIQVDDVVRAMHTLSSF
jgi:lipopolysaccharide heptosyltransferase II